MFYMIVSNHKNTYAPVVVIAKLGAPHADVARFSYGLPEASEQFSYFSGNGKLLYIFLCFLYCRDH